MHISSWLTFQAFAIARGDIETSKINRRLHRRVTFGIWIFEEIFTKKIPEEGRGYHTDETPLDSKVWKYPSVFLGLQVELCFSLNFEVQHA